MQNVLYKDLKSMTPRQQRERVLDITKLFLPFLLYNGIQGHSNEFVQTNEFKILQTNMTKLCFIVGDMEFFLTFNVALGCVEPFGSAIEEDNGS